MEKKEIIELIKKEVPSAEFPRNIDFSTKNNILYVTMDSRGVRDNMQDNSSAFEGWIFCIRHFIKNIDEVILNWDNPLYSNSKDLNLKKRQQRHYNRFLLRVIWCLQNYKWFKIEEIKTDEIENFKKIYSNLILNYPASDSKDKEEIEAGDNKNKFEAILETQLYHIFNELSPNSSNHQLPVGIFNSIKAKDTAITPHGASQVDLWQMKDNIFRIFELKDTENTQNKRVGIISELMFYANVFYHVFIIKDIKYPQEVFAKRKYFRGLELIVNALKNDNIRNIEAVFLTEELHPLISISVLDDLNQNSTGIKFNYKKVSSYKSK